MKLLLTLSVMILNLLVFNFASAAECERKIILLPQLVAKRSPMHPGPVALSQFMIAQNLAKFPDTPVFSDNVEHDLIMADLNESVDPEQTEGLDQDLNQDQIQKDKARLEQVKGTFPSGLPENFEQLTTAQKEAMAQEGGDVIAVLTGRFGTLLSAINGSEHQNAFAHEKEALSGINAYFSLNPEAKTVVLVLGAGFDLSRHEDQFKSECIETPAELKAFTAPANLKN